MYRGAHGREVILKRLGRQSPLGLSKLGSILGSIGRVFGLSIPARIDNFKVCRCNLAILVPDSRGVSKGHFLSSLKFDSRSARFETQGSDGRFEKSASAAASTRSSTGGARRIDANFALERVWLSFPATVACRGEKSKLRLGGSKAGSMKAWALLLDLFTTSFAPVRASKYTRQF